MQQGWQIGTLRQLGLALTSYQVTTTTIVGVVFVVLFLETFLEAKKIYFFKILILLSYFFNLFNLN